MTGVLIQRGNVDTQREKTTWEDEDRWGSASTSQGTCQVASKPLEAGREAWDTFSLSALRGNQPCPSLEFRLWASRTRREKSLWFKPPSLWDSVMEVLAEPYTLGWHYWVSSQPSLQQIWIIKTLEMIYFTPGTWHPPLLLQSQRKSP